jgi:3-methyladenine DNA glycosylase/8-oxoguanine DNA glycosylase
MVMRRLRPTGPYDLALTMSPLRHGFGDPTIRIDRGEVWRATVTPSGAATAQLVEHEGHVTVRAWGKGAEWILDHAEDICGLGDDPTAFQPRHRILRDLKRRHLGMHMPRTRAVWEALLPAVCEQKVTGAEAGRAYRFIIRTFGRRAPGPVPLMLPPHPSAIARAPYYAYHPGGLERRRADVLRRIATIAPRLETAADMTAMDAFQLLTSVHGVGPWTAAEVARVAFGDPDAVSVGDFHTPNLVAWVLAREPRATDERMLELLEPYRGQRGRAVRLMEVAGLRAPAFGPRMRPRHIERL